MFVGAFGDIRLNIVSFTHESGRDWVFQSPTRGDKHIGQDRGLRIRRTMCELVFVGPGYEDALRAFDEAAGSQDARLFTHPVRGSYLAVCEGWQYEADAEATEIRGQCTFVELEEPKAVSPLGAGVSPAAGPEAVAVAAEKADAALADIGLSSDAPQFAVSTVVGWVRDEEILPQTVQLQLASVASELDDTIELLQLAQDIESWGAYKQIVLLRRQVFQAAVSVLAETDRLVDFVVPSDAPLLTIATRLYGAQDARSRATQLAQLNSVKTPGMVRAGTRLKVAAP